VSPSFTVIINHRPYIFLKRRELAENVYERGLDAEDLSLSVRDFYEGNLSRREVNDLIERDPFFGAIMYVSALPLPRSK
jgi:hypothetical protein